VKNLIVFTGGGTAGHVLPNFPLIEKFLSEKWEVHYIGSKDGIEKKIINENFANIQYHEITCDKLRRYLTYKHFFVPFKLMYGLCEAISILRKLKPKLIFSKGGFVSVPVSLAAWILRTPIVIHESDYSIGLANKVVFPFAKLIAVSFNKSIYNPKYNQKMIEVGPLIRKSFLDITKPENLEINFVDKDKKTILIMGGSLGAKNINNCVYQNFQALKEKYNIIHICGGNNLPNFEYSKNSYYVFEYLNQGLSYLIFISDLIISRAGINSIWEIVMLKKPNILIPLSKAHSRGDQIENGQYFKNLNVSKIIDDQDINFNTLNHAIEEIFNNYDVYLKNINNLNLQLGDTKLYDEISKLL
jgi:UDP-N-acetylglucosamine--N-acetylmuramyl-(pentapeptide) pyrophosphoryl-undecaprenol N-acetylglucosamine transferase